MRDLFIIEYINNMIYNTKKSGIIFMSNNILEHLKERKKVNVK